MTGRKRDSVWSSFEILKEPGKPTRSRCKNCKLNMVGLTSRMKAHLKKCIIREPSSSLVNIEDSDDEISTDENEPLSELCKKRRQISQENQSPQLSNTEGDDNQSNVDAVGYIASTSQCSIDKFVVRTNIAEKKKIDIQVAQCVYALNMPFRAVEHPQFKLMINMLRPGYQPPNRKQIANELLDDVYNHIRKQIKENLSSKQVCLAIDGWSNIHNEPIIGICITDVQDESVHLIDSIDTSGHSHTSEYLLNLLVTAIKECEKYNCEITSVVTDNAANMTRMREDLSKSELGNRDILTYGCSAHIMNLLSKDLELSSIKGHITQISKYFRNNHFAGAKYREAGGSSLLLPQDTRWNTLCDCIGSYLNNWHILYKVCSENKVAIDKEIASKICNLNLKANAEDYQKVLKKISVALDKAQANFCTIGEVTEIWIILRKKLEEQFRGNEEQFQKVVKRFEMAMTSSRYLANLLDHRFRGENLNERQIDKALQYAQAYYPEAMPTIICYQAKSAPFKSYMFSENLVKTIKPVTWWSSFKDLNEDMRELARQLHTAVGSSAGIERLFSTYGIVQTKPRNKLGTQKAAKLVTIFKEFNNNSHPDN